MIVATIVIIIIGTNAAQTRGHIGAFNTSIIIIIITIITITY